MEELNRLYELRKKLEIKLDQISEDLEIQIMKKMKMNIIKFQI